ncbi:bifunctional aldolase/short-chain dehydrogenase [candidate division KSB1 bacterium]
MENRWSETEAAEFIKLYGNEWGEELALRTYSSRLLGGDPELVLYGGGNTSVKGVFESVLGDKIAAVWVKGSGHDLAGIGPEGFSPLDLDYLRRLRELEELSDEAMMDQFLTHLLDSRAARPSIETLMHAFLPHKFIDHTHADSILALTNRDDGAELVRKALGNDVIVVDYVRPGFQLAQAAADAFEASPEAPGMVLMKHGLVTWGGTAREAYEGTIDLVAKAESYLRTKAGSGVKTTKVTSVETARERYRIAGPIIRGALALSRGSGDDDNPWDRFILRSLINHETLDLVDSSNGKKLALTPPLTADHLVRTKALPLWIDEPAYEDPDKFREQVTAAVEQYSRDYDAYFDRNSSGLEPGVVRFDSRPRVIFLPGLGGICAGVDIGAAELARNITARTASIKLKSSGLGEYEGLDEEHLFDMEYFGLQHLKLSRAQPPALTGSVALVTGAAGAIGSGICRELLESGCLVAATDLPGDTLDSFNSELRSEFGGRAVAVPLDVTDPESVGRGFDAVIEAWGGIDLVVVNAGAAHVSKLTEMDPDDFSRLERVNVEGTLNVLTASGRHFRHQGTGGDIVLISTKNVFSPGAGFGAYSATKAAGHQLGRIASLELAGIDVRVNMVSPDAIFGEGKHKSGLWAEVGPDRMKARGLDQAGLEEYYRNRNLLKTRITTRHVARAVLFFATRQTPTTGATIPVDGGWPDSTPR